MIVPLDLKANHLKNKQKMPKIHREIQYLIGNVCISTKLTLEQCLMCLALQKKIVPKFF